MFYSTVTTGAHIVCPPAWRHINANAKTSHILTSRTHSKQPRANDVRPYQDIYIFKAIPHNSRLTAQAPLRRLRHGICVAKMLDKTSSIICAFGLASAVPRSPYRHLELCGIAFVFIIQSRQSKRQGVCAAFCDSLCGFAALSMLNGARRPFWRADFQT